MFGDVKAIYFDLDDTLCGYWDASKAAMRTAFAHHPATGVDVEEMVKAWAKAFRGFSSEVKSSHWYPIYLRNGGTSRLEQMRRMLDELGQPNLDLAKRLSDAYGMMRDENLALFPDAIPVLEKLYDKFPLGLITNGPADIQRQEIASLKIGHWFQHFYIEGEVGFGKPDMEIFRRAESAVGCKPHEVLMIGNSYGHDIRPAIEAGWRTIWIRRASDVAPSVDGSAKVEEIPVGGPSPDAEVGDLLSILTLLGTA
ncbi:MAG: HAD family hydrolase [Armatimonadetes bacterium]|nr:HAD family hydrolase [Armatimonadota bacterium]